MKKILMKKINPIQDGLFWGCSRMNTLPKEYPKNIWITCHTSWVLLTSALFHWKSVNFVIWTNRYRFHFGTLVLIILTFFNKHGYNFDNVSKIGLPRPSWNKIISKQRSWCHSFSTWHHNEILSPRSNYIVDHVVVMLPKFGNSGLAKGEVIINSNL